MASGWPYSKAHAESSRLEYRCRHYPDELHEVLGQKAGHEAEPTRPLYQIVQKVKLSRRPFR
jgi:hypothetical protein